MRTSPPGRGFCLTPSLGGCASGHALRRLSDWQIEQAANNKVFWQLAMMLAGEGGSVSVCGSGTGAYGFAAGVHACASFDDRGVGVGAGYQYGSGTAMGGELEVEVKMSTARIDGLSGEKTFYTRGHLTYAVSDKGHTSFALSVYHQGHMKGDYAGRQSYDSVYLFTWTELADWWSGPVDMSGGGICGYNYNNC